MKKTLPKYPRILAISPSSRGFGFAVLEGLNILADFGVRSAKKKKNATAIAQVKDLITHYRPDVLVLKSPPKNGAFRMQRILKLTERISRIGENRDVCIISFSRTQLNQA